MINRDYDVEAEMRQYTDASPLTEDDLIAIEEAYYAALDEAVAALAVNQETPAEMTGGFDEYPW